MSAARARLKFVAIVAAETGAPAARTEDSTALTRAESVSGHDALPAAFFVAD